MSMMSSSLLLFQMVLPAAVRIRRKSFDTHRGGQTLLFGILDKKRNKTEEKHQLSLSQEEADIE